MNAAKLGQLVNRSRQQNLAGVIDLTTPNINKPSMLTSTTKNVKKLPTIQNANFSHHYHADIFGARSQDILSGVHPESMRSGGSMMSRAQPDVIRRHKINNVSRDYGKTSPGNHVHVKPNGIYEAIQQTDIPSEE